MPSWIRVLFLSLLCCFGLAIPATGQTTAPDAAKKETDKTKDTASAKKVPAAEARILNAERITKLQTYLGQDMEMRVKIKGAQDKLVEAVRKVSKEIGSLDERLAGKNQLLEKVGKEAKGDEAERLGGEIKDLEIQKNLAQEQLDLTIKERKLVQERLTGLDQKIFQNQTMLDLLLGGGEAETGPGDGKEESGTVDPRLRLAREAARLKEASAKEAELESKSIEQRIRALERFLELDRSLATNEKKKLEITAQQQKALEEELQKKIKNEAPADDLEGLKKKLTETGSRIEEERQGLQDRTDRIGRLQTALTTLRKEQTLAEQEAATKLAEANHAQEELKQLENPFQLRAVWQWFLRHGLKILLILAAMFALRYLVRSLDQRLVRFMVDRAGQDSDEEREHRARTLASVFHNFAMLAVLCGGGLMLLEEMGIPVVPLMGGAAILGLAVAFGAQNLIKDYFYGFVILMENQYTVNDVVRIGGISGQVERISLRMTVLRDLEGVVHFIPHGQITAVSNLTQGWSRAKFEIGVSYKENVDQVMEILLKLGRELRQDPLYTDLILEDPEMLGVDQFSDSAVVIKFLMKTKPMMQFKIKREMLRRIKKTFDEVGIEIPFPHRVIYHHHGNEQGPSQRLAA